MRYQLNSPRKVIAVDLDEVLSRTTVAIVEFHNDTYGTSLTMDDFTSYDFTKVWGGTYEESIAKCRLFFNSPYFHKVEPVEGSLETLKLLKARRYSLVIVTARQQFVADLTKKFVDRHFPGIFESIYFANHFLTEQEKLNFISKPKSVICRDVHAQLLIDDSLENAIEVAKAGIPVLLFDLQGNYKWNKIPDNHPPLPDTVTRVKSWKEIQAWFPRPRSPLSNLCLSRDDQISDEEEDEEEEEEEEVMVVEEEEKEDKDDSESSDEDEHVEMVGEEQQQQRRRRALNSDSDLDETEEGMNDITNRQVNKETEENEDQDEGRTLRRRKLMGMEFSSSEDDEDINVEQDQNMDSDEQDFDLEKGHGGRRRRRRRNGHHPISHEDLELQHESLNMGDKDGMEMETEAEMRVVMETAKSTMMTMETFTQLDGDILLDSGIVAVATTTTTATATATTITTMGTSTTAIAAGQVSITAVQVESQPSLTTVAVEGLIMKGTVDMEKVPLV